VIARLALLWLVAAAFPAAALAGREGGSPVALVTAESADEVVAVSLPSGKVLRRVHLHDPETIATGTTGPAVVASPSGTVTILAWRTLRTVAVLHGFDSPELAAITPDGTWAYVTDAATGELSAIALASHRVVGSVFVGRGAHHLAIAPDGRRTWVALGERATTIVVLDTSHPDRLRVIARIHPPTLAHDLAVAPDGRTLWVTSDVASHVSVLDTRTGRLLGSVPAGPPPQHVTFVPFGRPRAYVTSGYGSSIELVDARTRAVIRRRGVPYGSFNLASSGGIVAVVSLLNGTVTELAGPTLSRLLTVKLAPATRDVAIAVW
jgi:DNA-binding beta-propeller fold protein YncE